MKHYDYIILGAGAAGLLTAYRMAQDTFFDNAEILIIEKQANKGNDRTWSFWENGRGEWDDILYKSWEHIYFGSKWISEEIPLKDYRYKTIRSNDFYNKINAVISKKTNIEVINDEVIEVKDKNDSVEVVAEMNSYTASKVFNSIDRKLYLEQDHYPVLNQHFLGWFVKTEKDTFNDSVATFMDFNIPQNNNTRFMYVLPFSKREALFEYTLFSQDLLEKSEYESEISNYLHNKGIEDFQIIEKEFGVIPMTSFKFHKQNTKNMLLIGTAGGWTKASTGYTFMNTAKKSKEVVSFLKQNNDLTTFYSPSRFSFYDLIMLDVLAKENGLGSRLFSCMFKKLEVKTIFKFLDEESNPYQELKVILSVPSKRFIQACLRRWF